MTDIDTGNPLLGANVVVHGKGIGAITDEHGYFQLENLLVGIYTVSASYIGYETLTISDITVFRDQPVHVNYQLSPKLIPIAEIEVFAERWTDIPTTDVFTITRRKIEESNFQSVGELLQGVPGVEIQNTGGLGNGKKISIRGSPTNQVLVLLDGMPLNDALMGEVDLSEVPINIIEKIEVYRGGTSPRFGGGAIGGVLNIITRDKFENNAQLNCMTGSWQLYQIEPSWSCSYGRFGCFVSYNYLQSQGDFPYSYETPDDRTIPENRINADLLSRNLFGHVSLGWGRHRICVKGGRVISNRGLPGKINYWTAYARANSRRDILGTQYVYNIDHLQVTIDLDYCESGNENSNLWPAHAELRYRRYPPYHYEAILKTSAINSTVQYSPLHWFRCTAGYTGRLLRYRDSDLLTGKNTTIGQAQDLSHGVLLHQEWKHHFSWLSWRVIVTPAIRYDEIVIDNAEIKRVEHQWSPGVGFLISVGDGNRFYLRSNLARSFRVPTFADLFYQDFRIKGKPDLLPEKSLNVDASFGWRLTTWGDIAGQITAFRYNIDDLIVWRLGNFEVFSPFNTDAEITGQEYSMELCSPEEFVTVLFSYSHLKPINKSNRRTTHNKILPYKPQDSFKANINLKFDPWQGGIHYRNVGRRFVTESNTIEMPQYKVLDTDVSWSFRVSSAELKCKFSVFNITDERHEILEDMPLPPREWRLGLSIKNPF